MSGSRRLLLNVQGRVMQHSQTTTWRVSSPLLARTRLIEIPGEILFTGIRNLVVPALDALDEPDVDEFREASVDLTA